MGAARSPTLWRKDGRRDGGTPPANSRDALAAEVGQGAITMARNGSRMAPCLRGAHGYGAATWHRTRQALKGLEIATTLRNDKFVEDGG